MVASCRLVHFGCEVVSNHSSRNSGQVGSFYFLVYCTELLGRNSTDACLWWLRAAYDGGTTKTPLHLFALALVARPLCGVAAAARLLVRRVSARAFAGAVGARATAAAKEACVAPTALTHDWKAA